MTPKVGDHITFFYRGTPALEGVVIEVDDYYTEDPTVHFRVIRRIGDTPAVSRVGDTTYDYASSCRVMLGPALMREE